MNDVRSSAAAPVPEKAPIWSSSAPYGNFTRDGYSWNNDVWGSGAGPQTISVYGANRWGVWSNQPGTGGIKSYPHEAVEFATLEWVDWFNNRRLLEPIGNIPPAEAEQRYYAMLEQSAMAA
ncbi:hypothetical protein EI171_00130 (plasmid) [Bradyrhizobium sp. LCT2]|nr:hypothetical protein EI171_00130 [Bradyrhizobium sp. LCT2]